MIGHLAVYHAWPRREFIRASPSAANALRENLTSYNIELRVFLWVQVHGRFFDSFTGYSFVLSGYFLAFVGWDLCRPTSEIIPTISATTAKNIFVITTSTHYVPYTFALSLSIKYYSRTKKWSKVKRLSHGVKMSTRLWHYIAIVHDIKISRSFPQTLFSNKMLRNSSYSASYPQKDGTSSCAVHWCDGVYTLLCTADPDP